MRYLKVQGTKNDFILIDEIQENLLLDDKERSAWAQVLCDRENGLGADGVLYVLQSKIADAMMRIFNTDGTEALMCGNGLRCFGRYVIESTGKKTVKVETLKATYSVSDVKGFFPGLKASAIDLDNVRYFGATPEIKEFEARLNNGLIFEHLTISNPHVVAFVDNSWLSDEKMIPMGQLANERGVVFGAGMNVNLVRVLDKHRIYVRTYERGVGITKSCGTGMTASVVAYARKNNLIGDWIEVFNDGGKVRCNVSESESGYAVRFEGNATWMHSGCVHSALGEPLAWQKEQSYDEEDAAFQRFFVNTRLELGM